MSSSGNYQTLSQHIKENAALREGLRQCDSRGGGMILFQGDVFLVLVRKVEAGSGKEPPRLGITIRQMPYMTSWMEAPVLLPPTALRMMQLESLKELKLRISIDNAIHTATLLAIPNLAQEPMNTFAEKNAS